MVWPAFLLMAFWVTKFSFLHYLVFYISTSADVTYNRNNIVCNGELLLWQWFYP